MRYCCEPIISAGDSSGNITSSAFDTSQVISLSVVGVFTDNASAGTLKIQVSNDATNWVDALVASATKTVAAGASALLEINVVSYLWVRVVWTRSAGAGSLTARIKTVGF